MSTDKQAAKGSAPRGAFLMLEGTGAGPFMIPDVPSPPGTDGWTPGVPVALSELGITATRAQQIVNTTGLFSLKGAEK